MLSGGCASNAIHLPSGEKLGCVTKIGLTGVIVIGTGVASPPVGANQALLKTGDTVLWYWAQFGVAGGPKTLVLSRSGRCYTVLAQDDSGKTSSAAGAVLHIGSRRTVATQNGRACIGRHLGLLVRAEEEGDVRPQLRGAPAERDHVFRGVPRERDVRFERIERSRQRRPLVDDLRQL